MPSFQLQTPVALMLFKRPDTTARVFQAIRQAQPPKLFLIADGARADRPGEAEQCAATRAIVEQVDWDCQVFRNYAAVNLGCGTRLCTGLDWVFDQVEAAILLEDDCLPHPSFFQYCEELLHRYRHDTRIMTICGDRTPIGFQSRRPQDSYYFSIYPRIWGWATWRRAWKLRDMEMPQWQQIQAGDWLRDIFQDEAMVQTWQRTLQTTAEDLSGFWDYQWSLTCWLNHGLSIIPQVNLVSNLGFGVAASKTTNIDDLRANAAVEAMAFPLVHPPFMVADRQADRFTHRQVHDFYSIRARLRRKAQTFRQWSKRVSR
jgi:hypothetical protein